MVQKMFHLVATITFVSFLGLQGMNDPQAEKQNLENKKYTKNLVKKHKEAVHFFTLSPDGNLAISIIGCKGIAIIWDIKSKEILWGAINVGAAAWNNDGKQFLLGFFDGKIMCFDVINGVTQSELCFVSKSKERISSLAWSKKNTFIAAGDEKGNIFLLNTINKKHFAGNMHDGPVYALAFSNDEEEMSLISGSWDKNFIFYSLKSGVTCEVKDAPSSIKAVVFSDDNKYVAVALWSGIVLLFSVGKDGLFALQERMGKKNIETGTAHIYSVAFIPAQKQDDKKTGFLACGCDDKTIKIFDLDTYEKVEEFAEHEGTVRSMVFCKKADGKNVLFSASEDCTVRETHLPS